MDLRSKDCREVRIADRLIIVDGKLPFDILDIIVLLIIALPMAFGRYRGFVYTVIRSVGWIGAVVLAFFATPFFSRLIEESFVGDMIRSRISEKIDSSVDGAVNTVDSIPQIIRGGITAATGEASTIFAGLVANVVISVMTFLLVMLIIRILLKIIVRPSARKEERSLLTSFDRTGGLLIGFVEGVLFAFLFLALLVPVVNLSSPDFSLTLLEQLRNSWFAGTLYDNNLLTLVTGGLFG